MHYEYNALFDEFFEQAIDTLVWAEIPEEHIGQFDSIDIVHGYYFDLIKKQMFTFWQQVEGLPIKDISHLAHDYVLTRNGHGAGYWDGDWPKALGAYLTRLVEDLPPMDLYVSDTRDLEVVSY